MKGRNSILSNKFVKVQKKRKKEEIRNKMMECSIYSYSNFDDKMSYMNSSLPQ